MRCEPNTPVIGPVVGQMKGCANQLPSIRLPRAAVFSSRSLAMRASVSGGGVTYFCGKPSMRWMAQSRRATSICRSVPVPSG